MSKKRLPLPSASGKRRRKKPSDTARLSQTRTPTIAVDRETTLAEETPTELGLWNLDNVAGAIETAHKMPFRILTGLHEGNDTMVLEALAELASCLECASDELQRAVRKLDPSAESEVQS